MRQEMRGKERYRRGRCFPPPPFALRQTRMDKMRKWSSGCLRLVSKCSQVWGIREEMEGSERGKRGKRKSGLHLSSNGLRSRQPTCLCLPASRVPSLLLLMLLLLLPLMRG